MKRYTSGIEFDSYAANYYVNKIKSSQARGIAFNLTFTQVKNMLRAKRCQLTGVLLTHNNAGVDSPNAVLRASDVTIDRLDCTKPYEKGNVVAVSHLANQAKNYFERQYIGESYNMLHKMSKELKKRGVGK